MLKPASHAMQLRPLEWIFFFCVIALSAGLLTTSHYLLALLPGLVILALLLLAKSPYTGYYLIIFLIPFGAYRGLSETYPFLKIHWVLAFYLILLIAFQFIVQKRVSATVRSHLWPWLLIFLVANFFSALLSDYPGTSFTNLFLLIVAYIFFILNLIFLSHRAFSKTLPAVLVISISLSAFLGLIGFVFNLKLFEISTEAGNFRRSVGATIDPNNFSLMIIFSLPILAHWFFVSRKISRRIVIILLILLNSGAVVTTYSRGGALVFICTLILLFFEHMKKFRPRYLGFVALFISAVIVTAVVLIPSSYWERQQSFMSAKKDRAAERRFSYLHVGWEAFKEKPLLGSGPGTFRDVFSETDYARYYQRREETLRRFAHNTYLEHLIGTGIIGLVLFIAIIGNVYNDFQEARTRFQLRGDKETASLVRAYQISFISLLLYLFMFSDIYHKYLIVSLALSQAALRLSQGPFEEAGHEGTGLSA